MKPRIVRKYDVWHVNFQGWILEARFIATLSREWPIEWAVAVSPIMARRLIDKALISR